MKKTFLLLFLLAISVNSYCQTNLEYYQQYELNRTYWNYRDRFKKQFIYLGTKLGDGLPMSSRIQDYCEGGSTRI